MLVTEPYRQQLALWPPRGRHILAQYDDESVVVYQAFRPSIAEYAVSHGRFGGDFSFERMSWIKPNFLWMMFRCAWARGENQQRVLAVRLRRAAFDELLASAVHSSFVAEVYGAREAWQQRVKRSSVRLQWDPDHDPHGNKRERRAIQLGLRGEALARYGHEWLLGVEDVTGFVHAQREHVDRLDLAQLETPRERVYPVGDPEVAARLELDAPE